LKVYHFLIFLAIVLTFYCGVNLYIYLHGLQAFSISPLIRKIYIFAFIFLASAFFLSRIIERIKIGIISNTLTWIGSYWLAAMIYFLVLVLLIYIVRLIHHQIPFLPQIFYQNPLKARFYLGIGSLVIVGLVLIAGRINALHPQVRHLEMKIDKKITGEKEFKIVLASDLHLGTVVGPRQLQKMVAQINMVCPDLILFAGDIIDEDPGLLIKKDLGKQLQDLRAPFGVYTVTGNHEYIGGVAAATKYLQDHGIIVLRDSVVTLSNGIVLVGREDRNGHRFRGEKRRSLNDLLTSIDREKPIILIDHQPVNLLEAVENQISLQLSGHTHHGQLWPFNYITAAIYRISHGYRKIGDSHFYISCGYGTWGPPIRTSSRPELVVLKLTFD
jgi:predicted MPP superfamily phosphohydrolase